MRGIIIGLCLTMTVHAMDREDYDTCMAMIERGDYEQVEPILDSLETHAAHDPETYVLIANYHAAKGIRETVFPREGAPDSSADVAILRDSQSGDTVAAMGATAVIDTPFVIEGIDKLHEGTLLKPARLDMWFGQASLSAAVGYTRGVERALLGVIERSLQNDNLWRWGFENAARENTTIGFMLENVQAYVNYLFNMGTVEADSAVLTVSRELVRSYPELKFGYSNIGAIQSLQGRHDSALVYLEKARALAPEDPVILSNIGSSLAKMGKRRKLRKFIKQVEQLGTDETREVAGELKEVL